MNFLVLVACIGSTHCPMSEPVKREVVAKNEQHCRSLAVQVIKSYGYKPSDFSIKCEPKAK